MTDFSTMSLTDVAALNTPEALDYFWAHVDDGYFADRELFNKIIFEHVQRHLDGWPRFTLCDYGCGCGHLLQTIHQRYPHGILYGIDYAASAIQQVMALDLNIGLIEGDITKPLIRPDYLTVGLCIEVLEHIPDYRLALQNMVNSLWDTCGHLIITVPNADNWHGHVNHWTQETLLALLSEYGEATVKPFYKEYNLIGHVVKR